MDEVYLEGKQIFISVHAIKRAREKEVAYPDQVYQSLKHSKIKKFGKNYIRFTSKSKRGSIICIGEDLGQIILIKTIERGN
ncbi:MAG TPA: hypothetical protein VJJ21_01215 [Candidatus Nanoarchaeia archaeon]|nr:hypothetical protein [Candidatus Nanoarchaeia archaeon]